MLNIENYGNFKTTGKQKKKKQIILCHTSREVKEYLTSLKVRYNSKYDKIPNYVIAKNGTILQLLPDDGHSNFFLNSNINRNSIIICLENLGWLEKKPLSNEFINWNGSIYNGNAYEKKWRDLYFWDPYTEIQNEMLFQLCLKIINSNKINKKFVGTNIVQREFENYSGILTRSNLSSLYTDLNPSFNYYEFKLKIENG